MAPSREELQAFGALSLPELRDYCARAQLQWKAAVRAASVSELATARRLMHAKMSYQGRDREQNRACAFPFGLSGHALFPPPPNSSGASKIYSSESLRHPL